jgi:hypothetical protein
MSLTASRAAADVPVQDASTLMLVRDGDDGLEVCMLRRNLRSDFVGGAYVFPGGGVDDHDRQPELSPWCGVLVARRRGERELLRFDDPEVEARFAAHRRAVDRGERLLLDVCREESVQLAVEGLRYVSRWITPVGAPRRYDTRFFVARAPEYQVALHDDREVIANLWIRPGDALDRHRAGEMELIYPTVRSLEWLATFTAADDALAVAEGIGDVPAIEPRIAPGDDGALRLLVPGDDGYTDVGPADGTAQVGPVEMARMARRRAHPTTDERRS